MRGMWTDDASLQIIKQKTIGTENKTILTLTINQLFTQTRQWSHLFCYSLPILMNSPQILPFTHTREAIYTGYGRKLEHLDETRIVTGRTSKLQKQVWISVLQENGSELYHCAIPIYQYFRTNILATTFIAHITARLGLVSNHLLVLWFTIRSTKYCTGINYRCFN